MTLFLNEMTGVLREAFANAERRPKPPDESPARRREGLCDVGVEHEVTLMNFTKWFEGSGGPCSCEEMCDQGDHGKNQQQVDQKSCHMKEHKATYPEERQENRQA
jgi:hypothetical protein